MAYGIQNLQQALQGQRPQRQDVQRLSGMGLDGDDTIGHLTSGEMIIPKEFQSPGIMSLVAGKMRQRGVNPAEFIVGTPSAQSNANPYTGAQQFKYGSDTSEGGATGGPGGGGNRDGGSRGFTSLDARAGQRGVGRRDAMPGDHNPFGPNTALMGALSGLKLGPLGLLGGALWGGINQLNAPPEYGRMTWEDAIEGPVTTGIGGIGREIAPRNHDRQARIQNLMRQSVGDTGGISSIDPQQPDLNDIDYAHYGETGGERIMYPWGSGITDLWNQQVGNI